MSPPTDRTHNLGLVSIPKHALHHYVDPSNPQKCNHIKRLSSGVKSILYNNRATARVFIGWYLLSIRVQTHRWRHCVVLLACVIKVHSSNRCCRQSFLKLAGPPQSKKVQSSYKSPESIVYLSKYLTGLNKLEEDSEWFEKLSNSVWKFLSDVEWQLNAMFKVYWFKQFSRWNKG